MMKLEINPKYNMLASFVRTIPEQFDDLGLVIYEDVIFFVNVWLVIYI